MNGKYLYMLIVNPYLWGFLSAVFSAMVFSRLTLRVKKNIYQHVNKISKIKGIAINSLLAVVFAWISFSLLGKKFVHGQTPLWLYFIIVLASSFILIRFLPRGIYFLLGLVITGVFSWSIAMRQWILISPHMWLNSPVMGIYAYDFFEKRADLFVWHAASWKMDKENFAKHWHSFAPLVNSFSAYASYPKGDVDYYFRGYVVESKPEFFFLYPARHFYPLDFKVMHMNSNTKEDPAMLWYIQLFRFVVNFREVEWNFKGKFAEGCCPVLFYPKDYPNATIPLMVISVDDGPLVKHNNEYVESGQVHQS